MTLISTVTVGAGGAANITFSSIPQTYTDLQVVLSGRNVNAPNAGSLSLNGSTASFTTRSLWANGNSVGSSNFTGGPEIGITGSGDTANTYGSLLAYLPNYTSATSKSISIDYVTENNDLYVSFAISGTTWANNAAITTIALIPQSGTLTQYSTASLYGILKGSGGATVS
jgi:hypothetical protein